MNELVATVIPISIIMNNVLGPTSKQIGKDLSSLYSKGVESIIRKASSKIEKIEDKKQANLRVARDVFWNGSFSNEEICAEYFGGILASSRTDDGKDDTAIFFLDIIKSLSSDQLKAHYIIYRCLNLELFACKDKSILNPGNQNDLDNEKIYLPLSPLLKEINANNLAPILFGLHAKGLISDFETKEEPVQENKVLPYINVTPTSLGIQLFAIANNKFDQWKSFSSYDYGNFDNVSLPVITAQSIDKLIEKEGLKK